MADSTIGDSKSRPDCEAPVERSSAERLNLAWLQTAELSRAEKFAYALLILGAVIAMAGGLTQAKQVLIHWPAMLKLVENVLS